MVLIQEFGCSVLVHLGWGAPYSNELHKAVVDAAIFDPKQRSDGWWSTPPSIALVRADG